MLKPRALEPGDRVAIVAPASPFNRDEFDQGIAEVRSLGFEPVYDDSVFARQRYVAGPPQLRAAAIGQAWRAYQLDQMSIEDAISEIEVAFNDYADRYIEKTGLTCG